MAESPTNNVLYAGDIVQTGPWAGFEVLSVYTRAQAIEDGQLIDVSTVAKEAGITVQVAVTNAVWGEYITPDDRSKKYGQSVDGRLWDCLWMLACAMKRNRDKDTIHYEVYFIMKEKQRRIIPLKAVLHGGDHGEPCITIMLPGED